MQLDTILEADESEFLLRFSDDLPLILKSWTTTTRISPVWKLKHEVVDVQVGKPMDLPESYEFIFLSATNPSWIVRNLSTETLQQLTQDDMWLSLGAYNLVVRCRNEDVSSELIQLSLKSQKSIERWGVNGAIDGRPRVEQIEPINPRTFSVQQYVESKPTASMAFETAQLPTDDTLNVMILEMFALTSVLETRSAGILPELKNDALGIQKVVAKILPNGVEAFDDDHEITEQKKRDLLLSLNAGLSRLASQALSGTTPITQTECHFWPHSLLGTGVANYALRNLTQFLTNAVVSNDYHRKFEALLSLPFEVPEACVDTNGCDFSSRYRSLKPEYYSTIRHLDSKDLLGKYDAEVEEKSSLDAYDEVLLGLTPNPITYFSGRDGFKNTLLTTSAPLMSVSGANCVKWNLGTISHEISHRIISGKVERLIKSLRKVLRGFSSHDSFVEWLIAEPETFHDYSMRMVSYFLASKVWEEQHGRSKDEIKSEFVPLIIAATKRNSRELEEILVHIFDFYHFYGCEREQYVQFVWHSWAVQPSISDKLDDYIIRTLLALAASRIEHQDALDRSIGDFQRICSSPEFREKMSPYISLLESRITNENYISRTKGMLKRYLSLVHLFFVVFCQENLRETATLDTAQDPVRKTERLKQPRDTEDDEESGEVGSLRTDSEKYKTVQYKYPARKRQFYDYSKSLDEGQFRNPLSFLRDFSRDDEPDHARSAWLLTLLAFNWLEVESDVATEGES